MFYPTSTMPNALLNHVAERLGAKNDAHLGRLLGVHGSGFTRIRNQEYAISDTLIIAILHALPELTLLDVQRIAGLSTEE